MTRAGWLGGWVDRDWVSWEGGPPPAPAPPRPAWPCSAGVWPQAAHNAGGALIHLPASSACTAPPRSRRPPRLWPYLLRQGPALADARVHCFMHACMHHTALGIGVRVGDCFMVVAGCGGPGSGGPGGQAAIAGDPDHVFACTCMPYRRVHLPCTAEQTHIRTGGNAQRLMLLLLLVLLTGGTVIG